MADPNDRIVRKLVHRELHRHAVDFGQSDIQVIHGVVYIRGVVRSLRGDASDLKSELQHIAGVLRQRREIKEVVLDCTYRS